MNKQLVKMICAVALGVMPYNMGYAISVSHDVVVNHDSGPVMTSSGDCVRTKWYGNGQLCNSYTEIMQMSERIIYFVFDKDMLRESEKTKLDVLVKALKEHNVKAVKIVGYTDRLGADSYNQDLSHRRALAVKRYLNSKMKLDSSIIDMRALGEKDQVKGCEEVTERTALIDCLAPNRRVEVEIDYTIQLK